jgi:hypothetical protein
MDSLISLSLAAVQWLKPRNQLVPMISRDSETPPHRRSREIAHDRRLQTSSRSCPEHAVT